MAKIQIEAAFVEKVLVGQDGPFGVKTSEPHRRKNDRGEWETTARTFRSIRGKNVDWSQFREGDRLAVFGTEKTEKRTHDGKDYFDLVVWADGVSLAGRREETHQPVQDDTPWSTPAPQSGAQPSEPWANQAALDDGTWAAPPSAFTAETPF